jgi:uncharacterized membrane protein
MSDRESRSFFADFRKNFFAGLFILIPVAVTIWVVSYLFSLLSALGLPAVEAIASVQRPAETNVAAVRQQIVSLREHLQQLENSLRPAGNTHQLWATLVFFKDVIAFVLVIVVIYLMGWLTNRVVGRRLLGVFDQLMQRIPLVKSIYGMMKQLLSTFQQKPDGVERVVLINFPSEQMKTVGLVMKTFKDSDTGRELAAVYVPTAPNPTSGYLELVPVEQVINTTWSVDEAMKFIVSGGSVGPETINYERSAARPSPPPPVDQPSQT